MNSGGPKEKTRMQVKARTNCLNNNEVEIKFINEFIN